MMDEPGSAEGASGLTEVRFAVPTLATGTPDYAAPEQLACAATDHRADIYSLGVVLYEMLTGERPGADTVVAPSRHAQVDARIDAIVLQALAKEPGQRFDTVGEFRSRIQQAQEALVRPRRRFGRAALWVAAAAAVIALASLSLSTPPPRGCRRGKRCGKLIGYGPDDLQIRGKPTDLFEAHKQVLRQTPDGGPPPAELTEKIARLEARDPVAARPLPLFCHRGRTEGTRSLPSGPSLSSNSRKT